VPLTGVPRRSLAARAGFVTLLLGLLAGSAPAHAASPRPLGRWHGWLDVGRVDLDEEATQDWGVDREGYLALSVSHGDDGRWYWGVELGHAKKGEATDGETGLIRDFDFGWIDLDQKWAFDLGHGWSADAGLGLAVFYVDGERETILGSGEVFFSSLAGFGLGAQIVVDASWRTGHLLLGAGVRYQWAYDIIDINHSNLRFGAHLGLVF